MNAVTVYSRENCFQCKLTYRDLENKGIDFDVVDLDKDPDALNRIQAAGHKSLPVVETPVGTWTGFRPDMLSDLAVAENAKV